MAGFTSQDDLINQITTNGKFQRCDWNKLTHPAGVHVAGEWHSPFTSNGNPGAGALGVVGTNLAFHALSDRSAGALNHGGDVGGFKHILNASAFSAAATTMPAILLLVDLLGYYPVSTVTTTGDQALINSKTFTADAGTDVITLAATWDAQSYMACRLTTTGTLPAGLSLATTYYYLRTGAGTGKLCTSLANVDSTTVVDITDAGTGTHTLTMYLDRCPSYGAGVQAFCTPSTALGAGTPNIRLTYTDQSGNTGNLTPSTLPVSKASAAIGIVEYSGTGTGKYGPFVPLAAGDSGIQMVEQFNYSATHTSGVTNVVLARPIASLPMTTIGVAAERDFINQLPSLPKIYDGACLAWLLYSGAATPVSSPFYGHIDFGWG